MRGAVMVEERCSGGGEVQWGGEVRGAVIRVFHFSILPLCNTCVLFIGVIYPLYGAIIRAPNRTAQPSPAPAMTNSAYCRYKGCVFRERGVAQARGPGICAAL